jgi:hypothetical protein
MNVTVSIDEGAAGEDDPNRSVEEFNRLSRRGHSRGWRFNRDEILSRKDQGNDRS